MSDAITQFLATIEPHGSFVARTREPPKNLHLEVEGVGTIPLPVSPTMARKLRSVATQAPYGLRDKTILASCRHFVAVYTKNTRRPVYFLPNGWSPTNGR